MTKQRGGVPRWAVLIGILSVLGALAPVTGDDQWSWFLWLACIPAAVLTKVDERLTLNVARAGRNGFFAAMGGLLLLLTMEMLRLPAEAIRGALVGLWVFLSLFFTGSLLYYERRGM